MDGQKKFYEVGSGRVDITPPLSIPYLGYRPRHSYFNGIYDNLYASAVIVSDGNKEIALISIDSIGFFNGILGEGRDFIKEVKENIEEETGIKKDAIMLMSAHIHSAPETLGFRSLRDTLGGAEWLEILMAQICTAVKLAQRKKFKAQLKIGRGKVEGISYNRRKESWLDSEVIILLFESIENDKNILLVNFACHPVIVQVQELVSADYVGSMREIVMNGLKCVQECLFIQGACGDINPEKDDTRDFKDVYLKGASLAGEVIRIYGMIADSTYLSEAAEIKYASSNIELASRPLPSDDECIQTERIYEQLKLQIEKCSPSEKTDIGEKIAKLEEVLCRIREGSNPYACEVQAIRLGSAVIIGIPGEPFCKMGIEIKKMFNPLIAIPAGYTNGYLGYIAPKESWENGGYEVGLGPWCKLNKDAFYKILDEIRRISVAII